MKNTYLKLTLKRKQSGLALFIALIALVVMSLAAVALIRSTDTNTLIAGNLAFKQSATASADAGVEAAMTQLIGMRDAAANVGLNVNSNPLHTFNITDLNARPGYHSSVCEVYDASAKVCTTPLDNLTDDAIWAASTKNAVKLTTDNSGNTVSYIIQRMCKKPGVAVDSASCLSSGTAENNRGDSIQRYNDVCEGDGCPVAAVSPQFRITVRVDGPRNAKSYIQAFVY